MGETRMEEMPLPALFEQARKIHSTECDSGADQETVRKGCEILQHCEEMIGKLGLFSLNETKEDISSTNLKYLLVPFYLGELMEKIVQDDRVQILKVSQAKLKEFLSMCEAMELVPEDELDTSSGGGPNALADRRVKKIARFKRQRAAEAKILEIKERKERRGRSTKATALSSPVEAGEEDVLDDDGEEEREAWLMTISLAICKAFDLLEMLKKEEEMFSAIKERQSQVGEKEFSQALDDECVKRENWHRNAAVRAQYSKPTQPITCATFAQDVLEGRAKVSQAHEHKHQPLIFGPASLIGGNLSTERERMAAQVFQPGHRLPTMSIEEAGLKEMEMMNKWQERTAKFMQEANSSWYKDNQNWGDDDEDDDAAQEKARAWDDWKDDHPRGAGNKKLTPCGSNESLAIVFRFLTMQSGAYVALDRHCGAFEVQCQQNLVPQVKTEDWIQK
ncbi:TAP46-like protein [Dillenia turbinata]|uniref:PP2A regulatory subunit TAP46 n=1 Tax=Dillenia turbinata TaxID=194707 RepID=A0AAN8Z4B8_9MAGN